MSILESLSERAKYTYLLELSHEQIRALESGDMYAFDRILLAKKAIIESLRDAQSLIASDPSVLDIIDRIKASELRAQEQLNRCVGRIKRELNEIQQYKSARRAYRRYAPAVAGGYSFRADRTIPRFIDRTF